MTKLFTSESVSAGHPDKVADRISDAIVDEILRLAAAERARKEGKPEEARPGRAAIETLVTKGLCVIAGETSFPEVDAAAIARDVIRDIGYDDEDFGPGIEIRVALQPQSIEIGGAVDKDDAGAGDQGLMFGYATSMEHTGDALMPAPLYFSHRILEKLAAYQKANPDKLGPDAKSQVTLEYRDGVPFRAHTLVVSHQHAKAFKDEVEALCRGVFHEVLPKGWFDENTRVFINPSGSFVKGGPAADAGLTGRKIIVDTYGGAAAHGGGAFSGKDGTKVDRSGAYAARWLAKNIVKAELATRCEIQLAYAIGVAEPLAIYVDTRGTGLLPDAVLAEVIREAQPSLSQKAIREKFGLDKPIFEKTASFGHFGREPNGDFFTWEKTDLVEKLKDAAARRR